MRIRKPHFRANSFAIAGGQSFGKSENNNKSKVLVWVSVHASIENKQTNFVAGGEHFFKQTSPQFIHVAALKFMI